MAYVVHNFQDGNILEAVQLNDMDNQIEENTNTLENIATAADVEAVLSGDTD